MLRNAVIPTRRISTYEYINNRLFRRSHVARRLRMDLSRTCISPRARLASARRVVSRSIGHSAKLPSYRIAGISSWRLEMLVTSWCRVSRTLKPRGRVTHPPAKSLIPNAIYVVAVKRFCIASLARSAKLTRVKRLEKDPVRYFRYALYL